MKNTVYYFCRLWYINIRHPILRFRYWRECVATDRWKVQERERIQELVAMGKDLIEDVKAHAEKDTMRKHSGLELPSEDFKGGLIKEEQGVKDYIENGIKDIRRTLKNEEVEIKIKEKEKKMTDKDRT